MFIFRSPEGKIESLTADLDLDNKVKTTVDCDIFT